MPNTPKLSLEREAVRMCEALSHFTVTREVQRHFYSYVVRLLLVSMKEKACRAGGWKSKMTPPPTSRRKGHFDI